MWQLGRLGHIDVAHVKCHHCNCSKIIQLYIACCIIRGFILMAGLTEALPSVSDIRNTHNTKFTQIVMVTCCFDTYTVPLVSVHASVSCSDMSETIITVWHRPYCHPKWGWPVKMYLSGQKGQENKHWLKTLYTSLELWKGCRWRLLYIQEL